MSTDFYVNGVRRTDDPQAATHRAEVEALARELFIAMWSDYPLTQQCDGSFPDDWDVAAWSFNGAEAWLAERDRRREEEK